MIDITKCNFTLVPAGTIEHIYVLRVRWEDGAYTIEARGSRARCEVVARDLVGECILGYTIDEVCE